MLMSVVQIHLSPPCFPVLSRQNPSKLHSLWTNTMNRWTPRFLTVIAAFAMISLATGAVHAQTEDGPNVRKFPPDAKRGVLVVSIAPDVSIDGRADRLAPGVRIRDANNALVLSSTLANARLVVNYTRGNTGLLQNIWVLNSAEEKLNRPDQR
jgi:hypothetical protein